MDIQIANRFSPPLYTSNQTRESYNTFPHKRFDKGDRKFNPQTGGTQMIIYRRNVLCYLHTLLAFSKKKMVIQ